MTVLLAKKKDKFPHLPTFTKEDEEKSSHNKQQGPFFSSLRNWLRQRKKAILFIFLILQLYIMVVSLVLIKSNNSCNTLSCAHRKILELFLPEFARHAIGSHIMARTGCFRFTPRCLDLTQWDQRGLDAPRCCRNFLRDSALALSWKLRDINITHWLGDGGLLGSLRYGHLTPWDTDVDFHVLIRSLEEYRRLRTVFPESGSFYDRSGDYITPSSVRASDCNRNRAEFSLYYFTSSGQEIYEGPSFLPSNVFPHFSKKTLMAEDANRVLYLRDEVFPLKSCKWFDSILPCPNKPVDYLLRYFGNGSLLEPHYKWCLPTGCPQRNRDLDEQEIRRKTVEVLREGFPSLAVHYGLSS